MGGFSNVGVGATVEVSEIESLLKGSIIVGDGTGAPTTRAVGTNNQALIADSANADGVKWAALATTLGGVLEDLDTLGAAAADGEFIVATGAGIFAYESGATLRTSMGVGAGDSPQFTGIELGHATDTTLTRSSAGVMAIEGTVVPLVSDNLSIFAATTSLQLLGVISDETGTGALVFATSPTLVTPLLGTPTSGTLTNCTGLPVSSGISGLGAGVATFLVTPSSANMIAAMTDETGSGSLVFATSPTLVTPALGTPASGVLTNCSGTAASLTAGNVTTNANLTGHVTSVGNAAVLGSFTVAQLNTALSDGTMQSQGDVLDDFNTLGAAASDGQIIVATGVGVFAYESGATLRTSIGIGTGDSPQFTGIELGHATDTTITRAAAGSLAVEGTVIPTISSTDTFTNKTFDANATGNSLSNVDVADLANGTDGELITWGADAVATTVATGTSGQVLTSNGAGTAPTFQAASGGGLTPTNKTANYTAVAGDLVICDASGAAFTVTLPASPIAGDNIAIYALDTAVSTNPVTVGRNGKSIDGSAADYTLGSDLDFINLVYDTTKGWIPIGKFSV